MRRSQLRRSAIIGLGAFALIAGSGMSAASASSPAASSGKTKVPLGSVHQNPPALKQHSPSHVNPQAAQAAAAARKPAARPLSTVTVDKIFNVNTTTDDTLSTTAPAGTCQDTADSTKCSFRAAVAAADAWFAGSGSTTQVVLINIPAGDYQLDNAVSSTPPTLSHAGSLILSGAGSNRSIIDGSTHSWANNLFVVANGTTAADMADVQISNLQWYGGNSSGSEYGGAIFNGAGDTMTIDHNLFSNNSTTSGYGGAIYSESSNSCGNSCTTPGSTLQVTSSGFDHNTSSDYGGAIYADTSNPLVLSGDTFTYNTTVSGSDGGAVYGNGDMQVDNDIFDHDSSGSSGGAVYADYNFNGTADTFTNNTAGSDAGALYGDYNVILTNSVITGNTASSDGGAIYNDYAGQYDRDTFTSNTSDSYGGDFYNSDQLTVTNSNFSNSVAYDEGGSIYNSDGMSLTNDVFTNVKSTNYSGGAIYNNYYAAAENIWIQGGHADDTEDGGGIYNSDYFTLTDSTVTGSTAAGDYGGGIYNSDYLTMNNDTVTNNSANYGGGLYNSDYLIINNSTFDHNTATADEGGGIYNDDYMTLTGSTLSNNDAHAGGSSSGYGGGLYNNDEAGLTNDTIAGNLAFYGGGIYNDSYPLNVTATTIARNTANGSGGGLYNYSSPATFTDSIIATNQPDQCLIESSSYTLTSGGHNLDSGTSCGLFAGGDIINGNPSLGALQNNGGPTQTFLPGSQAIGTGGNSCPATDQRGVAKPAQAACDIGSVYVTRSGGAFVDADGSVHPFGNSPVAATGPAYPGGNRARGITLNAAGTGGYWVDSYGGVHNFGSAPAAAATGGWPGWDIARGIAIDPCDPNQASGYVLDGLGGITPFGDAPAVAPSAGFSFDIARGIALQCNDGTVAGYVVDGWGGVHAFGGAFEPTSFAYYPGWDIVRGIALIAPNKGYTVDGWGGLHPFGGAPVLNATGYYYNWDIIRGITTVNGNGGWTLDAFGGTHQFGSAPYAASSHLTPGQYLAKGISS